MIHSWPYVEDAVQRSLDNQPQHALEMEMLRNREALEAARPKPPPAGQDGARGDRRNTDGGGSGGGGTPIQPVPQELLDALSGLQAGPYTH
jgi:hypothetical protein